MSSLKPPPGALRPRLSGEARKEGATGHDTCTHLDQIRDVTPSSWGCEDCLAAGRRDWVHLRVCQICGHVGCCDNSPGRHATAHFKGTTHPSSARTSRARTGTGATLDETFFEIEGAPPAPSHP